MELYRERSPIHFVDRISTPMLVLQGTEDEVVPPSQAEVMVEALEAKGLPYAYLLFEGEQHGFRKAETIIAELPRRSSPSTRRSLASSPAIASRGSRSRYLLSSGVRAWGRAEPQPDHRHGAHGLDEVRWLILCPDHLRHTPPRISAASSSSLAPARSGSRRSVSSSANRHDADLSLGGDAAGGCTCRRTARSRSAITPMPPGAPSANR